MLKSQMIYKAGKITFLLVCLLLCTACGKETAVFEADAEQKEQAELGIEQSLPEKKPQSVMVNINTAALEELMTLPGIGKVRAGSIIEYREQNGEFEKIEDIMNVKGIKTGIFSKINSLICVK